MYNWNPAKRWLAGFAFVWLLACEPAISTVSQRTQPAELPPISFGPSSPEAPTTDHQTQPSDDGQTPVAEPPPEPTLPLELLNNISVDRMMGTINDLSGFNSRNVYSSDSTAVQDAIASKFQAAGASAHKECFSLPSGWNTPSQQPCNVVAEINGSSATPLSIVVMAHFDSRADNWTDGTSKTPAANDNAAGIAVLVELAQLLSSSDPMHHIVFVATSAEEQGSFGGEHFRTSNAHASAQSLRALLNLDGIGGSVLNNGLWSSTHDAYVRLFHDPATSTPSYQLASYVSALGDGQPFYGSLQNAKDRPDRWGDQLGFIDAGLPAMRFTQAVEDPALINSIQDTSALIKKDYLSDIAGYVLTAAIFLAYTE